MYSVLPYTKQQAKRIGVTVKPSSNPEKKLDVFEDGDKVATIGDINYSDYPHYLQDKGKTIAEERRRLYHLRHKKGKKGTAGYYASVLLW
jgi:hypothetical protein